jgi:hypothetical protein
MSDLIRRLEVALSDRNERGIRELTVMVEEYNLQKITQALKQMEKMGKVRFPTSDKVCLK